MFGTTALGTATFLGDLVAPNPNGVVGDDKVAHRRVPPWHDNPPEEFMRIVIIGGHGQVGRAVTVAVHARGHQADAVLDATRTQRAGSAGSPGPEPASD